MAETKQVLSPEARQAQREYAKQWRAKNPERCRKYRKDFWEKRAAKQKDPAAD